MRSDGIGEGWRAGGVMFKGGGQGSAHPYGQALNSVR